MREFKFRAWDKNIKKFIRPTDLKIRGDNVIYYCESRDNMLIVMQYTGLKDRHGREIYEGDIVSHPSKELDRAEVKFTNGLFRIVAKDGRDDLLYYCNNIIEVIGNIYQNKDLLK